MFSSQMLLAYQVNPLILLGVSALEQVIYLLLPSLSV